ncbi:MAG: protein kinase [Kofleriaceae bacterium]
MMVEAASTGEAGPGSGSPDVPGYIVGERLGAGGFGEVFAARREQIGRQVAIKVLHTKYSTDAQAIARFISEARAVNRISHPGIVEIFDFGVLADGRYYCVMERLEGRTLRDLLAERDRLPLAEALPILQGIASAVDAAHTAGVAHRDLKPDNVFVLRSGEVKLIDFGLAKLTAEHETAITETGTIFGTPLYMSPEQCRGRGIDTRTDLYSFGVLAYHVITGTTPFTGEPLHIALAHLNDVPAAPSTHVPLSARADTVILALLAKDPQARPAPLAVALAALRGEGKLEPRRPRHRILILGITAAVLLAGTAAVVHRVRRSDPGPSWRGSRLDLRISGTPGVPSLSSDGERLFFTDNAGSWLMTLATNQTERPVPGMEGPVHERGPGHLVSVVGDRAIDIDKSSHEQSVLFSGADTLRTSPSRTGRFVATVSAENWLVVYEVATKQLRRLIDMRDYGWRGPPRWSFDDKSLLLSRVDARGSAAFLVLIDASSGAVTQVDVPMLPDIHTVTPADFLPDGRLVYCRLAEKGISVVARAAEGGPEERLGNMPGGAASLCTITTSADRVVVVTEEYVRSIALVDLQQPPSKRIPSELSYGSQCVGLQDVSDDGKELYYSHGLSGTHAPTQLDGSAGRPNIRLLDFQTGRDRPASLCTDDFAITRLGGALSHVGTMQRTGGDDVLTVRTASCDVLARWRFPAGTGWTSYLRCGKSICALLQKQGSNLAVWKMRVGEELAVQIANLPVPPHGYSRAHSIAIAPDDSAIAVVTDPTSPLLVIAADGTQRTIAHDGGWSALEWDRDPVFVLATGSEVENTQYGVTRVNVGTGDRELLVGSQISLLHSIRLDGARRLLSCATTPKIELHRFDRE